MRIRIGNRSRRASSRDNAAGRWAAAAFLILGWVGPRAASGTAFGNLAFLLRAEEGVFEISLDDRPLLVYVFGADHPKPYVRELYSSSGVNVLEDAPLDHRHHHGIMYAVTVNGLDFWVETRESGRQVSLPQITRTVRNDSAGRRQAEFSQVIHWLPPSSAGAVPAAAAWLVEQRTLTLTPDPARGEVALDWSARFEVGPGIPQVKLTGPAYHGLGLRFAAPFHGVAARINAGGLPYGAEGTWDVTPAVWSAAWHGIGRREILVAMFNHPANPGRSTFFSRIKPFACLSGTQGIETEPLEYRAGQGWTLRHRVMVFSDRPTLGQLERRYRQWAE